MDYRAELIEILQQDFLSMADDPRAKGFVVDHQESIYIQQIDTAFSLDGAKALERLSGIVSSHVGAATVAAGFSAPVPQSMRVLPDCEVVLHVEWLHSTSTYTRGTLEGAWHEVPPRRRVPFPPFFPAQRYSPARRHALVGEA